jgi:hypothetical protein
LVSIAILSKEGTEYKFPHRSLQEYFAAYYVSVLSKENKQVLYNKMLNEFSKSDFSDLILSKSKGDNFLSLLYEMDRIELLKSLIVPALERVNNDLTSSEFKEIKINVKHCLSALINNYVFLQRIKVVTKSSDTQKEFEKFFKALTETSGGIHLLVSGKEKEKEKKLEVNTKNEKKYAILFAGIENLNVYIKEFTNKKVIEFKQEIKDFEQGEFDLVSMVK